MCKCECVLSFVLLSPSSLFPTPLSFKSRPSLALVLAPVLPLFPCACQTTPARGAVGGVESNSDNLLGPTSSKTGKAQSSQSQRETKREGGGRGVGARGGRARASERRRERELRERELRERERERKGKRKGKIYCFSTVFTLLHQ